MWRYIFNLYEMFYFIMHIVLFCCKPMQFILLVIFVHARDTHSKVIHQQVSWLVLESNAALRIATVFICFWHSDKIGLH